MDADGAAAVLDHDYNVVLLGNLYGNGSVDIV